MIGRPKAPIGTTQFEGLCELQCTRQEIATFFNVSEKTILRFCRRTYRMTFEEAFAYYRQGGFTALRKAMWKRALAGDATMQIWLSKQHLDMKDVVHQQVTDGDGKPLISLDVIRAIVGSSPPSDADDNTFPDDPADEPRGLTLRVASG